MKLSALAAGTALLLCAPVAMAQTNTPNTRPNTSPPANAAQTNGQSASAHGSLRAQVTDMLKSEGFSDIKVMPSSFLVRAKDKDGNPVVMNMTPDSVTEITELGSGSGSTSTDHTAAMPKASGAGFVSVPRNSELASNLIGLDVYNNSNQNIGQIKDVAMNKSGRADAYILSVGGFLGVATRYVAVAPSDVQVSYNDSDKKWHAAMNVNSDQLKQAPEFKYSGRFDAGKS